MRKLLFLVLLLASFMVYAQEEKIVRYDKFVMLNGRGEPIGNGKPVERKCVVIFNYGTGKDVKVIDEDGITGFYIRVSEVNTKEQDGKIIYQYTFAIDEKGNKVGFYLFKDQLVRYYYDKNNNIVFGFMHF